MLLKIYNSAGSLKLTASPNASSTVSEEVMGEYCVSAAFTHPAFVPLDVNDYAVVDGVRYKVRSSYRPRQKNRQTYEYNVKLYAPIHDAEDALFLFQADGEVTTEFSYDGDPRAHLQLWVDNMNRIAGQDVWSIGTVIAGDHKTIEYRNVYCWDAAFGSNGIAVTFNTEMWADGYVVNLCKAERGDRMELGYLQGLTGLAQEENGEVRFFTRLFPLGSTRNIDASKYGHARLQLPSGAAYVDRNTDLYGIKDGYEEAAFAHIYPKYVGTVTSVRSEQLTNEEGRDYTVYYFKDSGMDFNPADYEIPDHVKMLSFQTGELAGRGDGEGAFQANWHEDTQEWEIINVYPDDSTQLPGGEIIPQVGDTYIPWNFTLPQEYIDAAEQAYAEAVDDFLATYSFDTKKYNGTTDRNYVEDNGTPLKVGWNVRLLSEEYFAGGHKDTRITKVVRKLNDLCQATVTCTDQIGTGWKKTLENQLGSLYYELARKAEQTIIDIIKTTDTKTPGDHNVYSALRSRLEFLSKTHPETMSFLMTFLDGIVIGEHGFAGGLTGFGAKIDKKGYGEMRGLRLWEWLEVPEIRCNRVEVFLGIKWRVPGAGIVLTCTPDTDAEGRTLSTGTCVLKLEDGELGAVALDDIALGIYHFQDAALNATEDTDDGKGNFTFSGFATTYFRITGVSGSDHGTFTYSLRPGYTIHPQPQMHFACYGNFTDTSRQASVYETRTYTRKLWKQNTWEIGPQNIAQQDGDLSNLNINGMSLEGYSAYLNSVYFTGQILQVKPDGTPVRTANDRGAWAAGHYDYYDRVSHDGCIWLCVNESGTNAEPAESSADWLLQVRKGNDGKDGKDGINGADGVAGKDGTSIVWQGEAAQHPANPQDGWAYKNTTDRKSYVYRNGAWYVMTVDGVDGQDGASVSNLGDWKNGMFVPYLGIVRMGNASWQCINPDGTSNPPLWTINDKQGNRLLQTQDGGVTYGYILTGEVNSAEYVLLASDGTNGENGADGVAGKDGTSIVWQGEAAQHPDNPQNGWAYRNTTDKKSYVYQDGSWYQMTVDGIDGQNGKDGKDGLSIVWKGDLTTAPANPQLNWAYRDTDNGRVYIYNGNAWELMVVDGNDGADGAKGADGLSVFITYHDSTTQPAAPTGNGTTGGWHTDATNAAVWMSQKVAASATEGSWGTPIKIKGQDGKDGLSIVWKGDLATPPANPVKNWVYRDTDNGRVYIYNGNAWELMVLDGSNGADGAKGADGLSVFITYHDSTTQPAAPTGNGTTGGWHTVATSTSIWMSQKVATSATAGSWGTPIKIKGDKGDPGKDGINGADGVAGKDGTSIVWQGEAAQHPANPQDGWAYKNTTDRKSYVYQNGSWYQMTVDGVDGQDGASVSNLGDWKNGMFVPYLGIVRMGNASWQCINPDGTSNPPLWTINDKQGNRLLQTQDGGVTYGYILTGEVNSAEYVLLASDGTNGENGADGVAGKDGTSIVWQGEAAQHPDNPQNGWAYRNTTDKKSYVYQDGSWYQMTVDGIDGQNGKDGKDGLSIVWKGDLTTAPANPQLNWAYRDTDNGRVYIYNGNAWELMVVDGNDGADGAKGADGLSVFITYHDSTTQPAAPTGNGTTGGWHTDATNAAVWMSQKVAASATEGSWGTPIKIKGQDGKDGLSIVWKGDLATPPANPVKNWVYRDTDNGRVYIYNGNAWELMVVDGSNGADGAKGADGLSVFITYHDSTTQPAAPTGNGTTGGWHTAATSTSIWMSQKVAASATAGSWGTPIKIKGETGAPGKDGRGVSEVKNYYLATGAASGVTTGTGGWTEQVQNVTASKRYLWNYEEIIYTDGSSVKTTPSIVGNFAADGQDGTNGVGIAGVTEEYGLSTSQDTQPTSWTLLPPKMSATDKYLWNRETTKYTDNTTRTVTHLIAVYGDKGDSITHLGNWKTGLFVPYLGIVRMGYGTYMCINKNGTSNPPMWTIVDKDNNRLLQTQDGGRTYGYILTGEMNSAEYALMASDGADGLNGTNGIDGAPGKDGRTPYFHIKYSANANGNPMSETPSVYIGTYTDFTQADSDDPADYTWARFQGIQGIQGIPGTNGIDGKTYYLHIKYSNDGGTTFTGNGGEDPGKFMGTLVDLNPADSNTPSAYKWAQVRGEDGQPGKDGVSVTHHGNWKTGLFVPYMGIVRMGNASWICTNVSGTSNPPCWTITDKAGNRILQTLDGGRTYGYILTGENNTAEYDVVAEDGKPGQDGQNGQDGQQGIQGLQGCILRRSEWKTGTEYRNDESLTSGTRYVDVALVRDANTATGWRAYKCKSTHTSSSSNAPGNGTYWEEFGINTTSIFTDVIIAKNASIDLMWGQQIAVTDNSHNPVAGLTSRGIGSNTNVCIFGGSITAGTAPFMVMRDGSMTSTKANITGTVNAVAGVIAGFSISGNSLTNVGFDNNAAVIFRNDTTKCFAGIGGNVFPATSGITCVGRFENCDTSDTWSWSKNVALYLRAEGAKFNYAFLGTGNGVLNGLVEGFALQYVSSSGTTVHSTDISKGKYVVFYTTSGTFNHLLPTRQNIQDALGIGTSQKFAVLLHYFTKYTAGGSVFLYGRTKDIGNADTEQIPYLYDHNGNNVNVQLSKGDSAQVLVVYDGYNFFAQLVNVRN